MFKPTQPLQARVAARLKGYRGPTLKLLRRVVRTVHPSARLRPINSPGAKYSNFTPKGLTTPRAWKSQHIALERLLPRFTNESQNTKELFQWRRYPERLEAPAPNDVSGKAVSKLPKLCQKIKRPIESHAATDVQSILTPEDVRRQIRLKQGGDFAPRHNPPAVERWSHDLYFYNKDTAKDLVVTSGATRRLIKAYYNMVPQGFTDVERNLREWKSLSRSTFRAFLSDGIRNEQPIRQDLLGKVSDRNKQSFYHPMKRLASTQVKVHFKYTAQGVKIMTQVYDRRIEVLKQRLAKVERQLRQAVKLEGAEGWALFARTCEALKR